MRTNQRERKPRRSRIYIPILIAVVLLAATGGLLARYVTTNRQQAEMTSAQFHISSNYLEENNPTYTVADWGDGLDIMLFNYEKENSAQVSDGKISYTVSVENGTYTVASGGTPVTATNGIYTIGTENASESVTHNLHIKPTDSAKKVTVKVTTSEPYAKTLKAEFNVTGKSLPDYKIADQGDGTVLLSISTNDYAGDITVTWAPETLSPDNTDILMTSWTDENPTNSFSAKAHSSYELLFFKNTDSSISPQEGSGTQIKLP